MNIKRMMGKYGELLFLSGIIALSGGHLNAQESSDLKDQTPFELATYEVIGSKENLFSIAGSGYFVDQDLLKEHNYTDINQVLRQTPGVYMRTEDGYGLFPNISLRGVDPGRSAKLTFMEDGVLSSPAPYSAPSAYHTPTMARMSGLEVLKGSSQVSYGPHTTGGVINYLSTPIPYEKSSFLKFSYGTDNEAIGHFWTGDRTQGDFGEIGYLFEAYHRSNDGFKEVDSTEAFDGSEVDTGLENTDAMIKLSWSPNTEKRQVFEYKIGYMDKEANETYLGISPIDFHVDPYRRYAASRDDNIDTQHLRSYLRYTVELNDRASLTSTAYYNGFRRNWSKLNEVKNIDEDGDGVIDSTPARKLYQAVGGIADGKPLEVLRGTRAGELEYRINDRTFKSNGFQNYLRFALDSGDASHDINIGLRYHEDEIRRFQHDWMHIQDAQGAYVSKVFEGFGTGGNGFWETKSWALSIEDTIRFGQLTIIPGVRYENIDYTYIDFRSDETNTVTGVGGRQLEVFSPGVGANYQFNENLVGFIGIYNGVSVPEPRSAARPDNPLDEETSLSIEAGMRWNNADTGFHGEVVAFNIDFENLITVFNVATGAGTPENVGAARTQGLEFIFGWDPASQNETFSMPLTLSATYTDSIFESDSTEANDGSVFAGGAVSGNKIPYVPEWQLSFRAGLDWEKFSAYATVTYADDAFASGFNTIHQFDAKGVPDARHGLIGKIFTVDLSANYRLNENAELFVSSTNLLDEHTLAGRLAHGPRPNAPRQSRIGMTLRY